MGGCTCGLGEIDVDPAIVAAIIGAIATIAAAAIGVWLKSKKQSDNNNIDDAGNVLRIDDVIVKKKQLVRLDVRLRNVGSTTVNVTQADLHILSRSPAAAAYAPSASYDLLLEAEHNVLPVAHALQRNDIDRFLIRVGFTPYNTSCAFTAELGLHYNEEYVTVSEPFHFDSFFG